MSLSNLKLKTLRIALKAYEPKLLDDSCCRIIESVRSNGTEITGPVPLPTKRRIYCVLRSPHVNKESKSLELDWEDETVKNTLVTKDGSVVNEIVKGVS